MEPNPLTPETLDELERLRSEAYVLVSPPHALIDPDKLAAYREMLSHYDTALIAAARKGMESDARVKRLVEALEEIAANMPKFTAGA